MTLMKFSYNKNLNSNYTIQKWNETLENVKHIWSIGMYSLRERYK
jgi:hypothetical protein